MADITRLNAFNLSPTAQKAFINGVTAMIKDGTYGKLVAIHVNLAHSMHTMEGNTRQSPGPWRFLPWHRAYLLEFETQLRKKEPHAFVPYWRWVVGKIPNWLQDFKPTVYVEKRPIENKRANDPGKIAT